MCGGGGEVTSAGRVKVNSLARLIAKAPSRALMMLETGL